MYIVHVADVKFNALDATFRIVSIEFISAITPVKSALVSDPLNVVLALIDVSSVEVKFVTKY